MSGLFIVGMLIGIVVLLSARHPIQPIREVTLVDGPLAGHVIFMYYRRTEFNIFCDGLVTYRPTRHNPDEWTSLGGLT